MKSVTHSIFKTFLLSVLVVAQMHFAYAQTASILPPAKTTFFDANGNPLTAGTIESFIPSTSTHKTTWQDAAETIPNANPLTLDAAGRTLLLGSGSYRQLVKDRLGNVIWDQVTSSAGGGSGGGTAATGDGDLVGTIKPWAGMIAPNQYVFTYGQELSRTTFSALFTAITSTQAVFCNSGSPILNGLGDTTNFWIGMPVELSCVAPGFTTVISKTATTVTLALNSNVTTGTNAIFFPWGRGNGSTTFNMPDLRGQVLAGNNNMGGTASSNLTTAFFGTQTPNASGAFGGNQSFQIALNNLPQSITSINAAQSISVAYGGNIALTSGTVSSVLLNGGAASKFPQTSTDWVGSASSNTVNSISVTSNNTGLAGAAVSATISNVGSGYTNGSQTITVAGGTCTTQPQFTITVAGNIFTGTPALLTAGSCTVAPSNPAATTGGGGTGGTLNVLYSGQQVSTIQPTKTTNYIIKVTPDTVSLVTVGVTSLGSMTGDITCGTGLLCTGNNVSVVTTLPNIRTRLTTNADYYVRRDGNDTCSGLFNATYNVITNPTNCAFLTIQRSLTLISNTIDFAGLNVIVHVQGANVGDGTYTENLILPDWIGGTRNGFNQWIVQAENGTATITGATATATILSVGTASPIQFKNFVLANANASGGIVEGDDGGFIALSNITFGSTGAAGFLAESTQSAGRVLFLAGTFTMQAGLTTGTGFLGRSGGEIIFQPGVTVNCPGACTFTNAVADFATMAFFDNTGSVFSGTVPTGKPYVLDKDSGARIVDVSLIPGSLGPTLTPLQVGSGGSGAISLTGILQGNGASAFTALTTAQLSALFTKPVVQLFTSGSGTYTKTANATWIEVELVGAGGGGAGSGTTPGAATAGGNTCFNTSGAACTTPVYQGGGGALGSVAGATSAAGGTITGSGTCSDSQPGGAGGSASLANSSYGGIGGASRYGGAGTPSFGGTNNATAGATNSGSGGGGAGQNVTPNAGGGGGAGAWCYALITAPAASYTYAIGAAGAAGTAGTGGNAGAAGAAGKLRVIEHFN